MKKLKKNAADPKSHFRGWKAFVTWELQILVYVAPATPLIIFLSQMNLRLLNYFNLIIFGLFFVSLACSLFSSSRVYRRSAQLSLIGIVWIPTLYSGMNLFSLCPGLWMMPLICAALILLAARFMADKRAKTVTQICLTALAGLVFLIACLDIKIEIIVFWYLLLIVVYGALIFMLSVRAGELIPRVIFLPIVMTLAVSFTASVDAYISKHPEKAARIEDQVGFESFNFEKIPSFYRYDVSFFVTTEKGFVVFPRHAGIAFVINEKGRLKKITLDGVPCDDAAYDYQKKKFYFFSGEMLYEGSLIDGSIREICSLKPYYSNVSFIKSPNRTRDYSPPNHIREYPPGAPDRLLMTYDTVPEVIVHDIPSKHTWSIGTSLRLNDCIWHPDGKRIIALGKDRQFVPRGAIQLLDLKGRLLREKPYDYTMADLVPTTAEYFFAARFFNRMVDKFSFETLEMHASIKASPAPRAVAYIADWNCLAVPSYVDGSLGFYNAGNLRLVKRALIGKRVRAITPSLKKHEYHASSASGFFNFDLKLILGKANEMNAQGK